MKVFDCICSYYVGFVIIFKLYGINTVVFHFHVNKYLHVHNVVLTWICFLGCPAAAADNTFWCCFIITFDIYFNFVLIFFFFHEKVPAKHLSTVHTMSRMFGGESMFHFMYTSYRKWVEWAECDEHLLDSFFHCRARN